MNTRKLPKIYYGYKKIRDLWMRQADSTDKTIMIECLTQSMKEIVETYMIEFEEELYKDAA